VLAAEVYSATEADTETILTSIDKAQANLDQVDGETDIEEAVADKGYHKAETLVELSVERGVRTYIPEPDRPHGRSWTDKAAGTASGRVANRRRVRGNRSKRLQKLRSEYVERTFAHVCETGGARRIWLRGLEKVRKHYLVRVAARNLGLILRTLFGIGTPRGLQGLSPLWAFSILPFGLIDDPGELVGSSGVFGSPKWLTRLSTASLCLGTKSNWLFQRAARRNHSPLSHQSALLFCEMVMCRFSPEGAIVSSQGREPLDSLGIGTHGVLLE